MEFRKDLNGLRAIAVTAVVFYHYGVWRFTGGFVGVDIFFVISGFLLTSIAYRDLQSGTFSAWQFLLRRMRRILPALIVVVAFCVLWETRSYLPNPYKHLVRIATDALIMRSNVDFDTIGYFTPDASKDIFLHTWSLGVESQFYLFFALLCGIFWPRNGARRKRIGAALFAVVVAASLAWCQWRTSTDALAAFYLLPSRAWEFLAGSVAAVYLRSPSNRTAREALGVAGVALLAAAIFGFTAASSFPGWRALLPVAGSMMLMLSSRSAVNRLLDAAPFQFLGNISYSVYLWHWPLLIVFRERVGRDPSAREAVALIAASLVAGWLSYVLVEQPTRRNLRRGAVLGGWVASIAVCLALSTVLSETKGMPQRLPGYLEPAIVATVNGHTGPGQCLRDGTKKLKDPITFCHLGAASQPTMMVWGDSFADRIAPTLDDAARSANLSSIVATMGGCPPFRGHAFPGSGAERFRSCERYANYVFDYFESHPEIRLVVMVGNWKLYDTDYETKVVRDIANILASRHGRLIFVAAVPDPFAIVPNELARRELAVGHALPGWSVDRAKEEATYEQGRKIASLALQTGVVTVVDPFKYLCSATDCEIVTDGQPLFSDDAHLSDLGVARLTPAVASAIGDYAQRSTAVAQVATAAHAN